MKLAYVAYPYMQKTDGVGKGYRASAFQLWNALRDVVASKGGELITTPQGEPGHPRAHLHYCPPHAFRPMKFKKNVLFTMWEGPKVPEMEAWSIARADVVIVPSEYCASIFRNSGLRVDAVVPFGVNPVMLETDTSRGIIATADRKFKVLWAGSTALRKGWPDLAAAWKNSLSERPDCLLRIKTIDKSTAAKSGVRRVEPTVEYDNRDVDDAGMAMIYQDADVYFSTSLAEGFGLQPLEAMACGALYVGPKVPGTEAFVDDTTGVIVERDEGAEAVYGNERFTIAKASIDSLAGGLVKAYRMWGSDWAQSRRRAGVERARGFLWTSTASRVYDAAEA